ncbi:MAG: histone deacetylase family protein, partial [Sphingomonadales bacterium]
KTFFSRDQLLHHGTAELFGNKLVPAHEMPARAEAVLASVQRTGLGEVIAPPDFGLEPLRRVHDRGYLDFLENVWADWTAAGGEGDALPPCTPMPDMSRRVPRSIWGRLSYYSFDTTAPITAHTWTAARASANSAIAGAELISAGEKSAFALCRPPGHHASRAYYGGYCFLNNAAIAAQRLRDNGASRVAVLDVDYHHGNGTQSIFYDRGDVFFASLHGDPEEDYPFFLGRADEAGTGAGEGANLNCPLPHGTGWTEWSDAFEVILSRLAAFRADALVVSLGVDTFDGDPITFFRLGADDFNRMGERLGGTGLPTLFVMEGGYDVDHIGLNVARVLGGFESRA